MCMQLLIALSFPKVLKVMVQCSLLSRALGGGVFLAARSLFLEACLFAINWKCPIKCFTHLQLPQVIIVAHTLLPFPQSSPVFCVPSFNYGIAIVSYTTQTCTTINTFHMWPARAQGHSSYSKQYKVHCIYTVKLAIHDMHLFHNNTAVRECKLYFHLSTHGTRWVNLIGPSLSMFVCRVHNPIYTIEDIHTCVIRVSNTAIPWTCTCLQLSCMYVCMSWSHHAVPCIYSQL